MSRIDELRQVIDSANEELLALRIQEIKDLYTLNKDKWFLTKNFDGVIYKRLDKISLDSRGLGLFTYFEVTGNSSSLYIVNPSDNFSCYSDEQFGENFMEIFKSAATVENSKALDSILEGFLYLKENLY